MTQPDVPGSPSAVGTGRWTRRLLEAAAVAVLVTATVGAVVPGAPGRACDTAAVALVTATPLLRVGALAVAFARERDGAYAAACLALLAIVAAGALLA